MKQIKTLNQANLKQSAVKGGCGRMVKHLVNLLAKHLAQLLTKNVRTRTINN